MFMWNVYKRQLARAIAFCCLSLCILLTVACVRGIPRGRWDVIERERINYLIPVGTADDRSEYEAAADRLDRLIQDIGPIWGYPDERQVLYYRFDSGEDIAALAGGRPVDSRAIPSFGLIHTIHAADVYRVVQVLTIYPLLQQAGDEPLRVGMFWLDGLAMYYTWPEVVYMSEQRPFHERLGVWNGKSVHFYAQELYRQGELPSLETLIFRAEGFYALNIDVRYPVAGSFVTLLLGYPSSDSHLVDQYRQFLIRSSSAESVAETAQLFAEVFGLSIEDAEANWHQFLQTWDESRLQPSDE